MQQLWYCITWLFFSERRVQYIRLKRIIHFRILENIYEIRLLRFQIILLLFDVPLSCHKTARKTKVWKWKLYIVNSRQSLSTNIYYPEWVDHQSKKILNMSTTALTTAWTRDDHWTMAEQAEKSWMDERDFYYRLLQWHLLFLRYHSKKTFSK